MNHPFAGQTVLITGATSGIGRQLALDYLADGAQVIALGRNVAQLVDLQQLGADTICCDLTDGKSLETSCSELAKRYNKIDLLILNAGVCHYVDDGQLDVAALEQTLSVNVVAPVALLAQLRSLLISSETNSERRGAKVVLIGSASMYLPFVRAEFYGASKAALSYLGQVLHNSLAPHGVTVINVTLGFIDTPLTQKNNFAMPMLASSREASNAIRQGISRGKQQIYFPKLFCGVLRLLHKLPTPARLWLANKLNESDSSSTSNHSTPHKDVTSR